MTKAYKLILCLLLLSTFNSFAQNEKNHWFFGQNAHIDFNSGTPVVGSGGLFTGEGCATASDKNGRLLFYTDGIIVYDRTGTPMNTTPLKGDPSSTHSALIVPNPGDKCKYYIFTTGIFSGDGMFVYEVDMTQRGGLGNVISTTGRLLLSDATEKIAVTPHANGNDYWVVTTRETTGFVEIYSWGITSAGIAATPNIFTSSHPITGRAAGYAPTSNYPGQIKFSNDGSLLAFAQLYYDYEIDFFSFDNVTGFPVSYITSFINSQGPYGVEFSPNGRYLYTTLYFGKKLLKLDISALPAISTVWLGTITAFRGGALQLSPDGQKIYVARMSANAIGEVNNINTATATYNNSAITLVSGTTCQLGLPTFISGQKFKSCTDFNSFHNAVPDLFSTAISQTLSTDGAIGKDKEFKDMDNDGDLDILFTSNFLELHWLENIATTGNPPAFNSTAVSLNVNNFKSYSYRLYDWDGDGWNDIICLGQDNISGVQGVYYLKNNNGTFATPILMVGNTVYKPDYSQSIAIGDLNKDNKPDILISGLIGTAQGTIYLENTGTIASPAFSLVAPQAFSATAGVSNPYIPDPSVGSLPVPEIYNIDCQNGNDIILSDPFYSGGGGRVEVYTHAGSTTNNTIPDISTTALNNVYGMYDHPDPGSKLNCDYVVTRIVDWFGNDCPIAVVYNACTKEFYYYKQDCGCPAIDFTVSVNEPEPATIVDISVYPNPVRDLLTIKNTSQVSINSYTIHSVDGKALKHAVYDKPEISVVNLSPGLYFIKLETDLGSKTFKIIKE